MGLAFYVGDNEWVTAAANLVDDRNRLIVDAINLESERRPVYPAYGVRYHPVRLVGIDAATGLALLFAWTEGWKSLRFGASAPLPEEPLLAAGYVAVDSEPPRDSAPGPPSCRHPAADETHVVGVEEAPPPDWDQLIGPSVEEAALEGILTIAGVPYLQHSLALEETFWTAAGGLIVNTHGVVVGILGTGPQSGLSLTVSASRKGWRGSAPLRTTAGPCSLARVERLPHPSRRARHRPSSGWQSRRSYCYDKSAACCGCQWSRRTYQLGPLDQSLQCETLGLGDHHQWDVLLAFTNEIGCRADADPSTVIRPVWPPLTTHRHQCSKTTNGAVCRSA